MKNKNLHKQGGFTLTEIIVVLLIIGGLIAVLLPTVRKNIDESDFKQAELFFSKSIVESLTTVFSRLGTVNGADAVRIQNTGITSESEWGGAWTMGAPCANERCIITYPIGGIDAAGTDTNGADLASKLTRIEGGQPIYPHIASAVYNAGADTLAVTVRVR